MNKFSILFRHLFKYQFKGSGKKPASMVIAYLVLGVIFAIFITGICINLYVYTPYMQKHGLLTSMLTIILAGGGMAVLFFAFIPAINTLFFSADAPFLLSLPIKPQTVFWAKMCVVYITELAVSALFLLPCAIVVGISVGLNFLFYIGVLLAIVLLPAIPLFLIVILAIPIAYLISYLKNKGAITSIIAIVALVAFILVYYFGLMSSVGGDMEITDIDALILSMKEWMLTLNSILLPLSSLTAFITGDSLTVFGDLGAFAPLVNLVLFMTLTAIIVAISLLISSKAYKRIMSKALESSGEKKMDKKKKNEVKTVLVALMLKEWRELFRMPAFALQCLAGIIMTPVLIIVMSFSLQMGTTETGFQEMALVSSLMTPIAIFLIAVLASGTNMGANTCVSREGKNFYFLKTIPVPYKTQLKAKYNLYLIISSVAVLTSLITFGFVYGDTLHLIFGGIFLFAYNFAQNSFGVLFDLTRPNLKWTLPNEIIKNSTNASLPLLIGMGMTLVSGILFAIVSVLWGSIGMVVGYLLLAVIYAVLGIIFTNKINNNAQKYIERVKF